MSSLVVNVSRLALGFEAEQQRRARAYEDLEKYIKRMYDLASSDTNAWEEMRDGESR